MNSKRKAGGMLQLRFYRLAIAVAGIVAISAPLAKLAHAEVLTTTVDFEDLTLAPESFYNGSDLAGEFTSRGATFNNTFTDFGGFTAWFGWSYSNTTDVVTQEFANQYSAYHLPGGGGDVSANYAMAFAVQPGDAFIDLSDGTVPSTLRVANSTLAALVMLDGDPNGFAKKFGGLSGDDPDWFLLSVTGEDAQGSPAGTAEFYLADYRFADNSLDFVVDTWTTFDLGDLVGSTTLSFALTSSDTGMFGINTPAYVAADNLIVLLVEGDGNADGSVDAADYTIWANGFGVGTRITEGDYNRDGSVGPADYTVWANHFGDTIAAAANSPGHAITVPEPGTMALAGALVAGAIVCRRRRRGPS